MQREIFTLSDGRNFEYLPNGPVQESAIVFHAGTTQDLTGWAMWLDKLAQRNIYALAIGRSGYAASTKKPGRITIDLESDVSELAHKLGIERFVNVGLSGGGQHAIATGLNSKSVGVVTIGSLAPFTEMGENFYTGMQQVDIDEYADALRDVNELVRRFQGWADKPVEESVAGSDLSENDKKAQKSKSWQVLMQSCEYTTQQGWDWVADDYSSYLSPWGFDPRDVKVPVVIWQGGLDRNVPVVHGQWLAKHLPNSRLELREDESHIGIYINYEDEIIQSSVDLLDLSRKKF